MQDFTAEELKAMKLGGSLIGLGFILAAIVMVIPFSILEIFSVLLAFSSIVAGVICILKGVSIKFE